jgi:hypothetical protein
MECWKSARSTFRPHRQDPALLLHPEQCLHMTWVSCGVKAKHPLFWRVTGKQILRRRLRMTF